MNDSPPDPIELPEEFPSLPAGELPDSDQLLPTEPAGPPAATNDPFGESLVAGATPVPPTPQNSSPPE